MVNFGASYYFSILEVFFFFWFEKVSLTPYSREHVFVRVIKGGNSTNFKIFSLIPFLFAIV